MAVLRPTSTNVREDQLSRLFNKGYYPIALLPRESILRIPTETGPKLSGAPLPKVPSGTVDSFNTGTVDTGSSGTCSWGPVVYVVLWKAAVRHKACGYNMKNFADDIQRYKHSKSLQMALLTTYKLQSLPKDPAQSTLGRAIDAALELLNKETNT